MVQQWMTKKRIEAQEKVSRLNKLKKISNDEQKKQKDFKNALDFQQWIKVKNLNHQATKREQEEKKKLSVTYQKCRESISNASYDKWKHSSNGKPKPVRMNRGLESLRGSTTKIFLNPVPWETSDD